MSIEWRDVPGYQGRYKCSSLGVVYSSVRGGREIKARKHRDGYPTLRLFDACGNKKTFHLHAIVAMTFLGSRPNGFYVDHIDGNRGNNAACNLRYLSVVDSQLNRRKSGSGIHNTGVPCVFRHGSRFGVRVRIDGKDKRLGRFDSIDAAKQAVESYKASRLVAAE